MTEMMIEKLAKERMEQVKIAMQLWNVYGRSYREMKLDYEALLENKRERGLRLDKLKNEILDSFPSIPFLKNEEEIDAIEYLRGGDLRQIKDLIAKIDAAVHGPIWGIIYQWNIKSRTQLRRYGLSKIYLDSSKSG